MFFLPSSASLLLCQSPDAGLPPCRATQVHHQLLGVVPQGMIQIRRKRSTGMRAFAPYRDNWTSPRAVQEIDYVFADVFNCTSYAPREKAPFNADKMRIHGYHKFLFDCASSVILNSAVVKYLEMYMPNIFLHQ